MTAINTVKISATGEVVSLSAVGPVSESEWKRLVYFWGSYSEPENPGALLEVPLVDFYAKKSWFSTHWLGMGNSVETDKSLKPAIERLKKLENTFLNLSQRQYIEPSSDLEAEVDELGLIRGLTKEQFRNIASLIDNPTGANFSVPGAGKTATTLITISLLIRRGLIDRAVVICPKSAFESWNKEPELIFSHPPEVEIFSGPIIAPGAKILLVNFEKLESESHRTFIKQWSRAGSTMLVIDEAHRIKRGASGRRWRACMELSSYSTRVELLTGTPMPQSYEDLRNLLTIPWKAVPKGRLSDQALSNMKTGGIFVRTTKKELNLPEPNYIPVNIEMGPVQKQIYSAITSHYRGLFTLNRTDQATLRKKGRAVMTVLAAATNPALIRRDSKEQLVSELQWPPEELSSDIGLIEALESYMTHELPEKYLWTAKFIQKLAKEERKVLVWSSFVGNLELLSSVLDKFQPAVIHGRVSQDERKTELYRFRQDQNCRVLLTNPQTLGEGISLHETTHDAVFIDRTYNAAQYLQALDRIHRLGLPEGTETNFYLLQSNGSLDKRVDIRLSSKIKALGEMLNDESLVSMSLSDTEEEKDLLSNLGLDQTDLSDILSHLGGPDG